MSAEQRLKKWLEVLKEPDAEMSKIAADKLGEIGSPDAVPELIVALERRTAFVASAAAQSLGKIRDKRAIKPLINALNTHQDIMVQTAAAESLGMLQATEAIPSLKKIIQDYLDAYKYDHFTKTRSHRRGLFTTCIATLKAMGNRDALRFAQQAESYAR